MNNLGQVGIITLPESLSESWLMTYLQIGQADTVQQIIQTTTPERNAQAPKQPHPRY